jgi:uncharacterized protein (DUF1810 family)
MTADPFALQRFVGAQNPVFAQVRAELAAGDKCRHWMWFIFPQIAGLGMSAMSQRYAISGRAEALAYLAHPVLGARLRDTTALVNALTERTAEQIFGGIDSQKFRSSMTLFGAVAPEEPAFAEALQKYFGGVPDAATLARM